MAAGTRPIQAKNQSTLPKPPRRTGRVSKRTAQAATTAIAGRLRKRNGARSCQSRTWVSSPAIHWATGPMAASTATIASSTARLLAVLPRV